MRPHDVPVRLLRTRTRLHDGQLLLLGPGGTTALNAEAAHLWHAMDGTRDAAALAADHAAVHGVDTATAWRDVDEVLTDLAEAELIGIVGAPTVSGSR